MQTGMKLAPGEIPTPVMDEILQLLQATCYGQIVLVAQDHRLIQVERHEKFRIVNGQLPQQANPLHAPEALELEGRIRSSFAALAYGQLTLVVKDGAVAQIERVARERFTGLDGEGI